MDDDCVDDSNQQKKTLSTTHIYTETHIKISTMKITHTHTQQRGNFVVFMFETDACVCEVVVVVMEVGTLVGEINP